MANQQLFDRSWSVTVGYPGQVGKTYNGLKTTFDLDKTAPLTSNKAKIELWNLSRETRKGFEKKGLQIQLQAGYVGLTDTLYLGDVVRVNTKRNGSDIVTEFELGDGEKNLVNTHFNKSYPAGTTAVQIFTDLAVSLNVGIGQVLGIQNQTYSSGVSFSGSVRHIMQKLLKNQSLEASIQNGQLQIIPISKHNGSTAIVLSKDTGLIGEPSQKESGIEFISLLNPGLYPGVPVQLISENVTGNPSVASGYFKIRKAHFEGDSHGEKWQVTCEAVRINATQTLPQNSGTKFKTVAG